jgi:hypothetical protein
VDARHGIVRELAPGRREVEVVGCEPLDPDLGGALTVTTTPEDMDD